MNLNEKEYASLVQSKADKSPLARNMLLAFLVGGGICAGGQGLSNLYQYWGAEQQTARTLVSLSLIFLSALLTGLGVFDKIAKYAGAGTLVPITGFANAVVSPAIEFKSEGLVLGVSAKLFSIAGPVLVYGISASVIYGIILWLGSIL